MSNHKRLEMNRISNVETVIMMDKFKPRPYQLPILDAIENKGYKRVLAILPRRAGKDITAFNLCIRECIKKVKVIYYIFPTYSQAKKVIWDSITNDGTRILDFIPDQLVESKNSQEMKVRFKNGSLLQLVGSDNYDCYDDKTEILTEDGWKLFKDLEENEKVATLLNGNLVFEEPLKRVSYPYSGEMYSIQNSSMNFVVTPNHRFWVKSSRGVYKFKEIQNPTIRSDVIPSQSNWEGQPIESILGYKSEDFMALLGIFLSEGSTFKNHKCYRVTISQTKPHIRSEIEFLLKQMGISYCSTKSGFNIENKELYEYFSQFGAQESRFIPKEVKALDKKHLHILLEWLILGDGHRCPTYTAYYSTSKKLVDDVQELIIKLGLSGNVVQKTQRPSVIRGREINNYRPLYQVSIRRSKFKRMVGAAGEKYIHTIPYEGMVYCVSVRSGVIKVRREGKEMWCGNSLMGTNPQGVVFSEYAMQDPRAYQFIRPILTANEGWALFITTPRGKNHLWEMYEIARQSKDWYCLKLTVEDTQHISLHEIMKEKAEGLMSDDLIQQEYYTSFEMGVEGSFYNKYLDAARTQGRIGVVPWESAFKVHTAWDIGVRDSTTIIFFQNIGQTVRIIDCYENSKQGIEHYVNILNSKPYTYGTHIAPHDIRVMEWGSGITRIEKARQLGVKFTLADDISIPDGIEACRTLFSRLWVDEKNAASLVKALENYRQEFDVKKKVYKTTPLHDWSSHMADAFRYLAVSLPKTRDSLSPDDLDKRYRQAMMGEQNLPPMFQGNQSYYLPNTGAKW